jgi:hypothetical protein
LQLDYDPVLGCVVHTWRGYFTEDEYRQAMRHCLELLHQTGARGLIVDMRTAAHDYWLDNPWTAETWFAELLATDVRKLAVVTAAAPSAIKHFFPAADSLLVGRYFSSLTEACAWISQQGI